MLLATFSSVCFAAEEAKKPAKQLGWGVALEGWRSEIDLYVGDIDGVDWQGAPINGQATNDPDENAKYSSQRLYSGLRGQLDFKPMEKLTLQAFARLGLVREIYQGKHYEGSFFVDYGDRPETDVVSFRGAFLFGFGAGGTYAYEDFRIGLDFALGYDQTSYKNQRWFDERTDGELSVFTFELRVKVGYTFGFITPRIAIGPYIYTASGEFQEILANNGRNDHFEAGFSGALPISITAGADIPVSERFFATIELAVLGEYALRMVLGMKL
jgi:hypothetical protein